MTKIIREKEKNNNHQRSTDLDWQFWGLIKHNNRGVLKISSYQMKIAKIFEKTTTKEIRTSPSLIHD